MEDVKQTASMPGVDYAQGQPAGQQMDAQAAQPQMSVDQMPGTQMGTAQMGSSQMGVAQGTYVAGAMGHAAEPQAGGIYQYVPSAGFVQVQPAQQPAMGAQQMNPTMQQGAYYAQQPDMGVPQMGAQAAQTAMGAQPSISAADGAATQAGMVGQGIPDGTEPKFDQNKIGQMYGVMTDVMNGEADPSAIMSMFEGIGADFWKGAAVGAVGALLVGNETVRNAVAGAFGSMFGEPDPEGPQVTLDTPVED